MREIDIVVAVRFKLMRLMWSECWMGQTISDEGNHTLQVFTDHKFILSIGPHDQIACHDEAYTIFENGPLADHSVVKLFEVEPAEVTSVINAFIGESIVQDLVGERLHEN